MLRPAKGTPIYQFTACSVKDDVTDIPAGLAHAAAVLVGRTLLLRTDAPLSGRFQPMSAARKPLSDAFLPGLFHFRMDAGVAAGAIQDGVERPEGLDALASKFRLIVVDSADFGASIALAPLCTGTVLVVLAGRTQVAAVRSVAAYIESVGGRILGTVLGGMTARAAAR